MPAELSPEARKLLDARKAAADELRQIDGVERSIHDHDVKRLASAHLYEQSVMTRVLNDEQITAAEFKAASDMVEAARSTAKALPTIKLEIVSGVVGIYTCSHCGARNELRDGSYQAPSKPVKPPSTIDVKVADKAEVKVLPPPTPPERKHPGSIHDQPGVPLKRLRRTLACL
jgi:hypothetical protein